MTRRLAVKLAVVIALASIPDSTASARERVSASWCGTCIPGGCPSAFTWDAICHSICDPTDLGWCSSGDASGACPMYFDGYLQCGTGPVS